jgi:NADPH2:quinone reductase
LWRGPASSIKATAWGARIMSIGVQAGRTADGGLPDMLFRTHTCVGTGQRPPEDRRAIWNRLLAIAREEQIAIDFARYTLEQAADAWDAQASSPHAKVIASIAS